jgi:GNAT superfamily N-acetyltransferase
MTGQATVRTTAPAWLTTAAQARHTALATRVLAEYDALRLRTYAKSEGLDRCIRVLEMGTATTLRFDDVGSFNRIYAPDQSIAKRLAEVEEFYAGCPFGCELVGPPEGSSEAIDRACEQRGWSRGQRYAWVYARTAWLRRRASDTAEFRIAPPSEAERETFLNCYLKGFEAAPERFAAAIRNMRHLFHVPQLQFLLAWKGHEPAGVGMLYRNSRATTLCASATLPEYRRSGCHRALLEARIQTAIGQGCKQLCALATLGSQSHANMEARGLITVGVSASWRFDPPARAPVPPD